MENKIIVAVDPFVSAENDLRTAAETIQSFAQALKAPLNAVGVVSPDQVDTPMRFDGTWMEQLELLGRQSLTDAVGRTGLEPTRADVLFQSSRSFKASAQMIADAAVATDSRLVAVFTHLKKRFFFRPLGSFAGNLLSRSKVPVLMVNSTGHAVREFKKIVFATDFSPASESAFLKLLTFAKDLDAEILIFNALTELRLVAYGKPSAVAGFNNYELFVKEQEALSLVRGARLKELANEAGCKAEFTLRHSNESVSNAIIRFGEENHADLISLGNIVHGAFALLFGSVTRELLENSKLPVLVVPKVIDESEQDRL